MVGDTENCGNSPSSVSPLAGLKSSVKSSRKALGTINFELPDPISPSKVAKSNASGLPVFDLSMDADTIISTDSIDALRSSTSCPDLLPIDCDLNDDTDDFAIQKKTAESPLLSVILPDTSYLSEDDSECGDELGFLKEPTSPSMRALETSKNASKNSDESSKNRSFGHFSSTPDPSGRQHTRLPPSAPSILEETLIYSGATPARSVRTSGMPIFTKRPVPVMATPSRIPRPMEKSKRSVQSTAAPGIRMPGDFHLSYETRETTFEREEINTTRLDLLPDYGPKCAIYLSSPYPRLTKGANHSAAFYEQKLAQQMRTFDLNPKPRREVAAATIMATTPKKQKPTISAHSTSSHAPSTAGGRRTIPISPKLATAARTRKCQCCEGGLHAHNARNTRAQALAKTTVGKRATTMRRRPSPKAGTVRFAPGTATPQHSHAKTIKRTVASTARKSTLTRARTDGANICDAPIAAPTTPAKPKLHLTTSLPEFKQPLAHIVPTPSKTRTEIDEKLKTPLPAVPSTAQLNSAQNKAILAMAQTPSTPIKMKSLDEILGPNYHLVHAFNEQNPHSNAPLVESLRR